MPLTISCLSTLQKQYDEVFEDSEEQPVGGRQQMRVDCFNVIIDALVVELNMRKQAYVEVSKKFGFLWQLHDI